MANEVAYGFIGSEALFTHRVKQVGQEKVDSMIAETLAEYERQTDSMLAWGMRSPIRSELVELAGSGEAQTIDEWGNPVPVKELAPYEQGYPIAFAADAWGLNRLTRAKLTVEDANRLMIRSMSRHSNTLRRRVLSALFTDTSFSFADGQNTAVTVRPLANGDSVTYVIEGADTVAATHTHYVAQAAAIADATDPFAVAYTHLIEHPSNAGSRIVSYIASSLKATTKALADFVPVASTDTVLGANLSRVREDISNDDLMKIKGPGGEILGQVDKVWVVEYPGLPTGYMITVAIDNAQPLLRMRYDDDFGPDMVEETNMVDGNREETRFLRYYGIAVHDRVGAVVTRIGNASYAIPTGYTAAY